ncbi:MAG: hypothetical protein AAGJ35_06205, partial [Myxococcota bacterium]
TPPNASGEQTIDVDATIQNNEAHTMEIPMTGNAQPTNVLLPEGALKGSDLSAFLTTVELLQNKADASVWKEFKDGEISSEKLAGNLLQTRATINSIYSAMGLVWIPAQFFDAFWKDYRALNGAEPMEKSALVQAFKDLGREIFMAPQAVAGLFNGDIDRYLEKNSPNPISETKPSEE